MPKKTAKKKQEQSGVFEVFKGSLSTRVALKAEWVLELDFP